MSDDFGIWIVDFGMDRYGSLVLSPESIVNFELGTSGFWNLDLGFRIEKDEREPRFGIL